MIELHLKASQTNFLISSSPSSHPRTMNCKKFPQQVASSPCRLQQNLTAHKLKKLDNNGFHSFHGSKKTQNKSPKKTFVSFFCRASLEKCIASDHVSTRNSLQAIDRMMQASEPTFNIH